MTNAANWNGDFHATPGGPGANDTGSAAFVGAGYRALGPTVIVVNTDRFFLTHRATWGIALQAAGSPVTVIAAETGYGDAIRKLGMQFHPMELGREELSSVGAISVAFRLLITLLRTRPRRVLLVATAAYALGWPAALFLWRAKFLLVVTGVGRVMSAPFVNSRASRVVRVSLRASALVPNVSALFQLVPDRDRFIASRLAARTRAHVVPGTGIDTREWVPVERTGTLRVLFASRLFREKGIYTFVEVARRLQGRAEFIVAGAPDAGVSTSVAHAEIEQWIDSGVIEYLGQVENMLSVYQGSDIFVFPSQHPEGTPKVLIEASACGIPSVAANQVGCRTVVDDGVSGLLADPFSVDQFVVAVDSLIDDGERRKRLGLAARQRIIDRFSLEDVLSCVLPLVGAYAMPSENSQ